jgi:hypothetical protein
MRTEIQVSLQASSRVSNSSCLRNLLKARFLCYPLVRRLPAGTVLFILGTISIFIAQGVSAQSVGSGVSVTISAPTATGVALSSSAQVKLGRSSTWEDHENLVIIAVVNEATKGAANTGHPMTTADYLSIAKQTKNWLDQQKALDAVFLPRTQAGRLLLVTNTLSSMANSSATLDPILIAALGGVEKLKVKRLRGPIDSQRQDLADLTLYDRQISGTQFIVDQVQEANDLAHNDSAYAAAINDILRNWLGYDTTNSYSDIKNANPDALPNLPAANSDGSFTIMLQDLMIQYQTKITELQGDINTDLTILESKPAISFSPSGETTMLYARSEAADPKDPFQDNLDKASAAVTATSKLIQKIDPTIANGIQTVGNATIQIASNVHKFAAITSIGTLFSDVTAVGGIIGGVQAIFGLFHGGGLSDAVLKQIKALSAQITRLQQDMDARFNKVDAELRQILSVLNQNFAQIDFQLGVLNGDAHAIQASLLDLQAQTNRLEQYLFAWTTALSKEQFIQTMNGCLGFNANFGTNMTFEQFTTCENAFYSWAHDTSLNELWAGLRQPDFSDGSIYPTLHDFPVSVDINYLARFAEQNLQLPALSTVRVANPNEWILGVRCYLQLANEWPQYAQKINPSRWDDLIQIGANTRQAMENANSTRIKGVVTANRPLFKGLEDKYIEDLNGLKGTFEGVKDSYVADPKNGITDEVTGITLNIEVGGANQATNWRPNIASIQRCDGSGPQLSTPSNLLNSVPDIYAFSQGYLKSGKMDMCIDSANFTSERVTFSFPALNVCSRITFPVPPNPKGFANICARFNCLPHVPTPNVLPIDPAQYSCVPRSVKAVAHLSANLKMTFQRTATAPAATVATATATSKGEILERKVARCVPDSNIGCDYILAATDADINAALADNWDGDLKPTLNGFQAIVQPQPQLFSSVAAEIDDRLWQHQRQIYAKIADSFGVIGPVQSAGQRLTGDALLLPAYLSFGLPSSVHTDPLSSLTYGDQSILDAAAFQADFTQFSKSDIPVTTDNKITAEVSKASERISAWSSAVGDALNRIEQNRVSESPLSLDEALENLQAHQTLEVAGAISPCDYQISPTAAAVTPGAGSGTVTIQVFDNCRWIASTQAPWLSANASGTGNGLLSYVVAANSSSAPREGIVIIGSETIKITQAGNTGSFANPVPMLSVLSPDSASAGRSSFNLAVNGSGFVPGAIVQWNGNNLNTIFVAGNQLLAAVSASDVLVVGTATIRVLNPTPGGGQSAGLTFTVKSQLERLLVTNQGTGNGTVTSDKGSINCGLVCSANFNAGTTVTLTATPTPGSTFDGWSGGCSGTQSCSLTMNSSQTVFATFTETQTLGLRFVPVNPCRIADTRNPNGPFGGPFVSGNTTRGFAIPSSACNIPSTAQAYSVNVTVVPHSAPLGFLTVFPCGQTQPFVSTLNSIDGRVKAAAAIVPAGIDGGVCFFATNDTELVLDINGYFDPATNASALAFYPMTPCRLVDTRGAAGTLGSPSLVGGGAARTFPFLASSCNVPAVARAYSLNLTSVPKGPLGFLAAWPAGQTQPLVSTLNAPTGVVTANAAIVPAGTNGDISVFVTNDSDLVIDINGYFAPPGAGGLSFFPLTPCRVVDTRNPPGSQPFIGELSVNVAASNCGALGVAQSYMLNTTVVPAGSLGFLTMWPQGAIQPLVSTLNALDGSVTSNMAIVFTTNGSVSAFALNPTHLVIDISGYFAP